MNMKIHLIQAQFC